MLRINQIKLSIDKTEEDIKKKVLKMLHLKESDLLHFEIIKQSIDARKKPQIYYVYTVDIEAQQEESILKRAKGMQISLVKPKIYDIPKLNPNGSYPRPVICGFGPAGIFCGYLLALAGMKPIILERGKAVDERMNDVEKFWKDGTLNTESNVQFGEGGAGTFSDGKLNTLVKDPIGRNRFVLETFVSHGAPKEILYWNKPHIGTDILSKVIANLRQDIIHHGGEVRFESCLTDLTIEKGQLSSITINGTEQLPASLLVLAPGHSARDTFETLCHKGLPMEAKSFAVGMRVEHPQSMINESQYGHNPSKELPAAAYKVTAKTSTGRGVYSFCMCPGGYVVNASSEKGRLAVNGMSYNDRKGANANSAIIVTVTPEDYGTHHPLAGMEFQRTLEEKAYALGNGKIPVQCYEDFKLHKLTKKFGTVLPQCKGAYCFADLRSLFSDEISNAFIEGMESFAHKIHGFSRPDCILSGVESRTSSPVKIMRNLQCESDIRGIFPCGEGAGFAGGIMSAAMDGMKVAESIVDMYTN